jgi:hypothetical protein
MEWIRQAGEIAGIRYYGCNSRGDSHLDPDHPDNESGLSGPTFRTEMFVGHGGQVLPSLLRIGHPIDPEEV